MRNVIEVVTELNSIIAELTKPVDQVGIADVVYRLSIINTNMRIQTSYADQLIGTELDSAGPAELHAECDNLVYQSLHNLADKNNDDATEQIILDIKQCANRLTEVYLTK